MKAEATVSKILGESCGMQISSTRGKSKTINFLPPQQTTPSTYNFDIPSNNNTTSSIDAKASDQVMTFNT